MRYCVVFLAFVALYFAAVIWSIGSGSVSIMPDEIVNIIFNGDETNKVAYNVIWKIRLPRLLLSSVLGGALSLSGYLI